ncbi:xanthine dehydrogenase family Fe-S subunit [Noviherbaspirillum galbum]|uniref:2Fe-2S iron-sulfur cluster binding domain-containing protein n=1 Tax=Noviherbaspirillum galbum TaxID=2709383 RepID=A0A6B3SUJ2_9BURK|nr:2Fe-2S iron-sulfur cluster-binding protein [Noviherbaspirillum galbum]NEX64690.1 2Fe-2S iron-sulfur cluster binding domain-containing protein [Noviherbaspirillum galbum]
MESISIQVNGRSVCRDAEPRTHLGDFLRDELHLTGTHLGCEHGVCGACTVLLDGQPVRSCITFAVACAGQEVTTIEGYDGDPVMQLLRPAFTRHHALQCGYCTPGMLTTARDIVLRIPDADEARIRLELSGNLCRCTGYQGIVNAIQDVLQQQRDNPDPRIEELRQMPRSRPTPAATAAATAQPSVVRLPTPQGKTQERPSSPAPANRSSGGTAESASPADSQQGTATKAKGKGNTIDAFFDVPFPLERVWQFMGDLPAIASCLPGATIESQEGEKVKGSIAIKFGPMSAAFAGAARLERDDAVKRAVLRGAGQDSLSKSRAQGDITYELQAISAENTRVNVNMVYALQGPLAQFSRSGLVKDFVSRMVADFGKQVTRRLDGQAPSATESEPSISLAGMMWSVLWNRVRGWFGRSPKP